MPNPSAVPWETKSRAIVPVSVTSPPDIAQRAVQLRKREVSQIVSGFAAHHYEMVSNFVWTKALTALRKQLSTLGSDFIGEMLQRPDIALGSDLQGAVTALEAISLAEDLGMISHTDAMRLRHAHETINHFSEYGLDAADDDDDEGMTREEAVNCLRVCVNSILGHPQLEVAQSFALKTTLSVLLAMLRSASGAQLEHAVRNTNVILPAVWGKLRKPERWQAGQTYAELYAEGKKAAVSGLQLALSKVSGFDYVPENLRSATFTRAAKAVLQAHEDLNNFYNEPAPMRELASLGTTIPNPAFPICMTATLSVWLGNSYGFSWAAADPATRILKSLSSERWTYYLDEVLPRDKEILIKLQRQKPSDRWAELVRSFDIKSSSVNNRRVGALIRAGQQRSFEHIRTAATNLLNHVFRAAA